MRRMLWFVAGLLAAGWWLWPPPSAQEVAAAMAVDIPAGRIRYDGNVYALHLSAEPETHAGRVRVYVRADHGDMPVITHEGVVTTGEFSDPEKVEIGPLRGGSTWWRAKHRPRGTLMVLHLIPADAAVAAVLDGIGEGETWTFTGFGVIDQTIVRDDGHRVRLGHDNHRFLLVTDATPGLPPEPAE